VRRFAGVSSGGAIVIGRMCKADRSEPSTSLLILIRRELYRIEVPRLYFFALVANADSIRRRIASQRRPAWRQVHQIGFVLLFAVEWQSS
jgi:hypothetical protein